MCIIRVKYDQHQYFDDYMCNIKSARQQILIFTRIHDRTSINQNFTKIKSTHLILAQNLMYKLQY